MGRVFIEAGDAAEPLDFAKKTFSQVAVTVKVGRDWALEADTARGRNMGLAPARCDPLDQGQAVVAAIGGGGAGRQRVEQDRRHRLARGPTGRHVQADRQAILIDDGVDLGAQSATRAADGVILAPPFFLPATCWWARTMELSINCSDCGERRASSLNTFSQIPRLSRLWTRV